MTQQTNTMGALTNADLDRRPSPLRPRLFGFELHIHWSWFIIAALVTWDLAAYYFPEAYPGWTRLQDWLAGLVTALLFFASVLTHELAHSLVARSRGLTVASITLFVFGGVSSLVDEPRTANDEFWMTIVGPATSFALAVLFFLLWLGGHALAGGMVAAVSGYLAFINFAVGLFNLLPGFPLDGGRVLRSLLWRAKHDQLAATRIAANAGQAVAFLLLGIGVVMLFSGAILNGIWLIVIGWFLQNAAISSYRDMQTQGVLRGLAIAPLIEFGIPCLPEEFTLRQFVDDVILGSDRRACFVGQDEAHVEGLITLTDLRKVPKSQWDSITIGQVMTPRSRLITATAGTPAATVLQLMVQHDVNQLPVLAQDAPPGLLSRAALLRALQNRAEFGPSPSGYAGESTK